VKRSILVKESSRNNREILDNLVKSQKRILHGTEKQVLQDHAGFFVVPTIVNNL